MKTIMIYCFIDGLNIKGPRLMFKLLNLLKLNSLLIQIPFTSTNTLLNDTLYFIRNMGF